MERALSVVLKSMSQALSAQPLLPINVEYQSLFIVYKQKTVARGEGPWLTNEYVVVVAR
jgi:hypothetical protein